MGMANGHITSWAVGLSIAVFNAFMYGKDVRVNFGWADKRFRRSSSSCLRWFWRVCCCSEDDGRSLQILCLLQVLRLSVLLYEWLDIAILKKYYCFGFDHYRLSRREIGVKGLISLLLGKSGPFANSNWILPDLSIHAAKKFNSRVQTYPNTFYFRQVRLLRPSFVFGVIIRLLFDDCIQNAFIGLWPIMSWACELN